MPRTGRPPKPVEMKRKLGNPGKRTLSNPVTALAPVTVITHVSDEPEDGADLVRALLDAGASAWIGTTDQLAVLRMVSDGWDRRRRLLAFLAEHGGSYAASSDRGGERWYPRPEVAELRDLEKQITTWLSSLGLDPASRGRLGVAEVKVRSKLEELRTRAAQRRSATSA